MFLFFYSFSIASWNRGNYLLDIQIGRIKFNSGVKLEFDPGG